ncbi:unnamed protein product [Heligmosomoides polygyrus]|uniref:Protein kinase domain-containing protein n=1 Tax=Heligmosomoides polygyrus TaxID=6339 RepID=A0A3P7WPL5_HELPZ|nr:unnamed protein product [Heligmosomoides polygyrus]
MSSLETSESEEREPEIIYDHTDEGTTQDDNDRCSDATRTGISGVTTEGEGISDTTTIDDSSGLKTPRELRMLHPLRKQLHFVNALSRLTSLSRMNLIRVLVDVHNSLESLDDAIVETENEILESLAVVEERLDAEECDSDRHHRQIRETLAPVLRRFHALEGLRLKITPLAERVAVNDATTNLLRTNTTIAKQAIAQVVSAMSGLRETLLLVDRFLSRSQAWLELKPFMEMQSCGIEKGFLDEFPATHLDDYLDCCPSTSLSSAVANSSTALESLSPCKTGQMRTVKLDSWSSASLLSAAATSSISSTLLLSAHMIASEMLNSYNLLPDDGTSHREVLVEASEESSHRNGIGSSLGPSNTTLSSCSSFEDAVLMEPHKGLGDNNDLMETMTECLRTALETQHLSTAHDSECQTADVSSKRLRTAAGLEPLSTVPFFEYLGTAVDVDFLKTAEGSELLRTAPASEYLSTAQGYLHTTLHARLLNEGENLKDQKTARAFGKHI